jgi:hypothetical protein
MVAHGQKKAPTSAERSALIFICDHEELMEVRDVFLTKLYAEIPEIRGQPIFRFLPFHQDTS